MSYYDRQIEPDGNWINKGGNCTLPHDSAVNDPDKLRQLSGPVKIYFIEASPKIQREHVQCELSTY